MQRFAVVTKHFLCTDRMSAILFQHRVYQSLSPWIPAFFDPYCCKITAAPAFRPFDACSQRESAFSLGTSDFNHMSCKSIIELLWILFRCARTTFRGCVKCAVFSAICHLRQAAGVGTPARGSLFYGRGCRSRLRCPDLHRYRCGSCPQ